MIVVNLICDLKHSFEGWFASAEALQAQQANGQLCCPICESPQVDVLASVSHTRRASDRQPEHALEITADVDNSARASALLAAAGLPDTLNAQELLQALMQKLQEAGARPGQPEAFAIEVHRLQDGETELRAIRGISSLQEIESLLEESISLIPIAKENLH
ncbi:DUF1178 family protein [Uliginosibacterium sediminicola]|uniref:DUF1178 family protein n=1 Tax=Uliginosibacterium sediminicola TaxID=2024550 RepID=A0ABU9YZZ1_9RHOO